MNSLNYSNFFIYPSNEMANHRFFKGSLGTRFFKTAWDFTSLAETKLLFLFLANMPLLHLNAQNVELFETHKRLTHFVYPNSVVFFFLKKPNFYIHVLSENYKNLIITLKLLLRAKQLTVLKELC